MKSAQQKELEARIRALEAENLELRKRSLWTSSGQTVRVPEPFQPLFDVAEKTVRQFFSQTRIDPGQGTIEISNERYVFLRASSLSVDFLKTVKNLYSDYGEEEAFEIGRTLLFDIAHVIGMEDAKNFHRKMGVTDPIAKLSAGPVHFAYSGWAFVDISPESSPQPNQDYFLKYDHPYSFEADSWLQAGEMSTRPVCIMNSGYSSGWCEESFGMPLTAVELTCRAAGDDRCSFIMAPPDRIEEHVGRLLPERKTSLRIPSFFERKRIQEEMKSAREKAEDSDRLKSRFLANMSHEIRTPMNGVIGMTELVLDTELTEQQREYLNAAKDSAELLMSLINEVLDFSKIEADATLLQFERFDFRRTLAETIRPFQIQGRQKNLDVHWQVADDVPDCLAGDPARLQQIIVNLLGNSIKFTEQGRIDVTARRVESEADLATVMVKFNVSDTGIGIPQEKMETIFDAFTQVDMSSTRSHGGTGLGLAISRELVNLMNGRIWCENNPGGGCSFHFQIPLAVAEDAASDSPAVHAEPATHRDNPLPASGRGEVRVLAERNLNVLVAEDSIVNQKLAASLLTQWGCRITVAEDGEEAVRLWQDAEPPFDLILMDILMPKLDGLDATKAIRALEKETAVHTPIIAVTAQALVGDQDTCLNAGMDAYISKPIRREALLKAIQQIT